MLELFTVFKTVEFYSNLNEGYSFDYIPNKIPSSWIVTALIIGFGTAYIAYSCNEYEVPATRALYTIFAFFFSGIYLIFYFIYHIMFGYKFGSVSNISNLVRNFSKK